MSVQTPFQILLEIDQRCRVLAAGLPSQQAAVQSWSGIGFRMGERFFVAPMGEVGEVLHEPRYTLLPGVKSWVKGVANVRGRLLPIMDLCGFFGNELSPLRKLRRVLVVDDRGRLIGVVTEGDLARATRQVPELEHELTRMVGDVSERRSGSPGPE